MRNYRKIFFYEPFIIQECITYTILVPALVFFFYKISPSIEDHILEVISYVVMQTIFSIGLGAWAKYHFAGNAVRIMENQVAEITEIRQAMRAATKQPFVEALTIFLRWIVVAWIAVILPIYVKQYCGIDLALLVSVFLAMAGLSAMGVYYLSAENSLAPFFEWCGAQGVFTRETHIWKIGLSQKLVGVILLIAIPPLGEFLGVIYFCIFSGIKLSSIHLGFIIILVQTFVMTMFNSYLFMKGLKLSVVRMGVMLEDVAHGSGDLTKRLEIRSADELGELAYWFNIFMSDLERMIGRMKEMASDVHHIVENVNTGSQGLSQTTQEQAATVDEVSASVEEINGTVQQNAELIHEGKEVSASITALIDQSKNVFLSLMQSISEVSQDSKKIGDIVSSVNEVAFHTNLLALNASVEAARAGEHGKGFAVVAQEVRSLAQRSAIAAGEIRALIESTVRRIQNSDVMVKKTSATFEELMSRLGMFFQMMETINISSREQAQSIGELDRAIVQIGDSTQQNAATVQELSGTIENLRGIAMELAEDLSKFKTFRSKRDKNL